MRAGYPAILDERRIRVRESDRERPSPHPPLPPAPREGGAVARLLQGGAKAEPARLWRLPL